MSLSRSFLFTFFSFYNFTFPPFFFFFLLSFFSPLTDTVYPHTHPPDLYSNVNDGVSKSIAYWEEGSEKSIARAIGTLRDTMPHLHELMCVKGQKRPDLAKKLRAMLNHTLEDYRLREEEVIRRWEGQQEEKKIAVAARKKEQKGFVF